MVSVMGWILVIFFALIPVFGSILLILLISPVEEQEKKEKICFAGIILAIVELVVLVLTDILEVVEPLSFLMYIGALLPLVLYILLLIYYSLRKDCSASDEKAIRILKKIAITIQIIISVIVFVIPVLILIIDTIENIVVPRNIGIVHLDSENAMAHNMTFENYFGSNVTSDEVVYLLSEIRTNNLNATSNEEIATIGVCFIANDVTTDENNGIYKKSQIGIDSTNLKKSDFENLNFSPDIEQMKNYINIEKNYIVFCPNTKTWDLTKKRVSGFNEDKNFLGQPQIAETGAYYSNGYIRLIYIVENN